MMLIYPRYDPVGIDAYYAGDFTSGRGVSKPVMWVDELGEQVLGSPFQSAEVGGGGVEMSGTIVWNGMGKDDFDGIIKAVSAQFQLQDFNHRPFAIGTIFSPPKSISLAALAGPRIEPGIIEAHRTAVGFVAGLIARMLVTRKHGEDVPIRARVLRFTHPFSRADDPQLHDHLEWIPDPRDGALHTYPLFFFQHALRQIYHFCLAAELGKLGFQIEVSDAEELRWELPGVDHNEVMLFSKRSAEVEALARAGHRDSLAAALRWAALSSSKGLPKYPRVAIGAVRTGWEAECPRERCAVSVGDRREYSPLVIPELDRLFQKSSLASLLTLQGRALGLCLGQVCDPQSAMRQIDHTLFTMAQHGRLVVTKVRSSRAFVLPDRFREERELLKLVGGGIGKGERLTATMPLKELDPKLKAALNVSNRIRVVSAPIPKGCGFGYAAPALSGKSVPAVVPLLSAGVAGALREVRGQGHSNFVLASDCPFRNGDFLAYAQVVSLFRGIEPPDPRQRTFTLRKGMGRSKTVTKVEVRGGCLPRDPEVPWMELENRPPEQMAACLVPADYPEAIRRDMNMEMATRLILSRPFMEPSALISIDLVVPQEEAKAGMELVVFKNHLKYGLRTRWRIREVFADGSMNLRKKRASITLSAEEIHRLSDYLSVVDCRKIRVVSGMRLQAEKSFALRKPEKISLKKGEIVTALRLAEDGSLVLADGRVIPPVFRAFSPAFLLRTFPVGKERPGVILAQAPNKNVRERVLGFRSPMVVFFTNDPARFAADLGCEVRLLRAQRRIQTTLRFISGEGEFVPSIKRCTELLELHKHSLPVSEAKMSMVVPDAIIPPCVPRRKKKEVEEELEIPVNQPDTASPVVIAGNQNPGKPKKAGPKKVDDKVK